MQTEAIDGVLLVDKEPDMTSHDVVAIARRTINQKKIGHCGTLDPMATGLLILVLGKATKLQDLLMAEQKEYVGALRLGATTTTQDREGEILEERPVPELSEEQIRACFDEFLGAFEQIPPMVSAIKKDGVPLYKLARQGKTVDRPPRPVEVFEYEILEMALPVIHFRVVCSKGFYVRTYAFDIGERLGCGGHLDALRRTRSGNFLASSGMTVTDLKAGDRDLVKGAALNLAEVSRLRGS